jgi:predicted secreted hydrolase
VDAGGAVTPIRFDQFSLEARAQWRSDATGASYPIEWRVTLPGRPLDLTLRAVLANQEVNARDTLGLTWWEGAVEIAGRHRNRNVRGRGHAELNGYGGGPGT